jgi:hypothetical protein
MKKQHRTSNEKNKGVSSNPLPKARTEKDPDDLVHSQPEELPLNAGEEDPDDLVHRPSKSRPGNKNESGMEDPDDLAHG